MAVKTILRILQFSPEKAELIVRIKRRGGPPHCGQLRQTLPASPVTSWPSWVSPAHALAPDGRGGNYSPSLGSVTSGGRTGSDPALPPIRGLRSVHLPSFAPVRPPASGSAAGLATRGRSPSVSAASAALALAFPWMVVKSKLRAAPIACITSKPASVCRARAMCATPLRHRRLAGGGEAAVDRVLTSVPYIGPPVGSCSLQHRPRNCGRLCKL